jgi:aflatoxin B1 aldehyde reductase
MQQAIQLISTAAAMHEMSLQSAALRWLAYHSKLGQEDSIILGGSTFEDVEEKTAVIAKGPLPEEMVSLLQNVGENLWDGSIVL